ncbi:MAG: hypothetical protein A4E36_00676 [Methanoregulaceae archaeon PtaB.Bin009]|jgi:formylmethanofuran dehydrogenase subunit D|nr:MAG: hypothetical protein A4E36_00676 [Methanoregulaceae archaeon PtaB.Bin009]OPY42195.1 MAG: hypothetical protein A4E41_00425 [Methanoregulaceae archaeon PtaU1.Bin066]
MDSVKLKVQERAFPSRGRARLHKSYLSQLGIKEGDDVEISLGEEAKPVVVAVFADTLVEEGHIRLSPEDIAAIGAAPGSSVIVTRRPPLADRVKTGAETTAEKVKGGAAQAAEKIRGGAPEAAGKVKESATQAAEKVKEGASQAAEKVKEGASVAKESIEKSTETVKKKLQDKDL